MRKISISILTLLAFVLILAGCGETTPTESVSKETTTTEKEVSDTNEQATADDTLGNFIFTADEGGSITKINAETDQVVSSIKLEGSVHNVQVSPDGKVLAATLVPQMNHGDHGTMSMKGSVLFYNTESDELISKVEVGNHPAHVVFTNNGEFVLVANNEDNNVSIIDTSNYSVVQTIDTGKGPHGFRISKDSRLAYIANMGEDSVSVINLETMKEEKRIKVGAAPVTVGITSDGKTLVATLNTENALSIIDLETDTVEKVSVGQGPAQVYIDHNDKFAYVANQGTEDAPSHSVSKVDITTKEVVSTIEVGNGSHGVVTSPDSKLAYVTNMYDNTVNVIDTELNEVINTIEVGEIPNGISIMP
ncbi:MULTISPECIES: YncE family protein [Bacillaceae]|jgi:YVTN family beta-propeller protein|uniref:YVTN family beta-propeller repeat-containing protein n=1 Tax=Oceanobacillus bengalensis TaxID=1435466 RepID=A0A494YRL9_9BACI|nr:MULTISPECIES: cytochrome D1 domain-containing protein [Bacillaceae]RKQ12107.1 YVTN family beta-propeller repeat-containing protein [Oceanobacillus bengalensis]